MDIRPVSKDVISLGVGLGQKSAFLVCTEVNSDIDGLQITCYRKLQNILVGFKSIVFGMKLHLAQIRALPFTGSVIEGNLVNHSKALFPHPENKGNNTYIIGLSWGLNKILCKWCWALDLIIVIGDLFLRENTSRRATNVFATVLLWGWFSITKIMEMNQGNIGLGKIDGRDLREMKLNKLWKNDTNRRQKGGRVKGGRDIGCVQISQLFSVVCQIVVSCWVEVQCSYYFIWRLSVV